MNNQPPEKTAYLLLLLASILQFSGCTTPASNVSGTTTGTKQTTTQSGIPLNCQAPVLRPATYKTGREVIRVFEPSPVYQNTPATIEWGIKRIQTEPARMTNETVPARYKEVSETVIVLRERTELKGIPAVYKTIDRPVTIAPAHTVWKKGCVPQNNPAECFEQIAKQTRIIKQQIIDVPAKIIQQRIPAETITIKKKVLVKPGQGNGAIIPPRYTDVKTGRVSQVWQINAVTPPPRYEALQIQKTDRPEQLLKAASFCTDSTADPGHIRQIQQRLQQRGLPIKVSGTFDQQSWLALTRFQQENDLFIGAVTEETLRKLGL
ncbi:MAG: peptidoglycan-binding protein [Thiolinea sp.]